MYSPTVVSDGLERLIRSAIQTAQQSGQTEVLARLEAVLGRPDNEAPSRYELDLLAAEVRRGPIVIALSRGERALLIALALQRRPCTRAELVELLYPHLDELNAATQLKVYVHRVRRRLGDPQTIVFSANGYRLGSNVDVDFWQVQSEITQATRMGGALTQDVRNRLNQIRVRLERRNVSWNGDHEWGNALERRLEALLFDVTARLGEAALADRDSTEALRLATEISNLDPCDERGVKLMIRAHLSAGDRDAAIRSLRRYERALREELDARPSPEIAVLLNERQS